MNSYFLTNSYSKIIELKTSYKNILEHLQNKLSFIDAVQGGIS